MKRFVIALLLFVPTGMPAAVADSAANGFTIKLSLQIQASPDDVYRKVVHNVGDWWSPAHTFSQDAHNLSIEEKPMGCFCEKLPGGGAVRHLEVVNFAPGKTLVMTGGLGPMQTLAVAGTLTLAFTPAQGGTKLDITYAVGGYLSAGLNTWAAPADGMLTEQFTRLKNLMEHGDPAFK
jgi:uncharacterized protein YndB with AHSA1/START domain